jgi:VIT1/CCC1 family predicted Fe2+/Mn2+ transporter
VQLGDHPVVAVPVPATRHSARTSLICTAIALFAVGLAKGRVAQMALTRSGQQVVFVGSASAALGYAVGRLVSLVAGG